MLKEATVCAVQPLWLKENYGRSLSLRSPLLYLSETLVPIQDFSGLAWTIWSRDLQRHQNNIHIPGCDYRTDYLAEPSMHRLSRKVLYTLESTRPHGLVPFPRLQYSSED
jgi:hypothetical protein